MATLTRLLGLAPTVRPLNVIALSSSALLSLSFIVFLNTIQPFFLSTYLDPPVPNDEVGTVTGIIIAGDELLTLVAVFIWGVVADRLTVRRVASSGHLIIGVAFFLYPLAKNALPGVLLARLVFATGASALLTALGAALAGMTVVPETSTASPPSPALAPRISVTRASTLDLSRHNVTERTTLLPPESGIKEEGPDPRNAARYAGLLGFASGCGALLGVFGWFRLPGAFDSMTPASAIRSSFYVVGTVALFEGCFLNEGLKRRPVAVSQSLEEDEPQQEEDGALGKEKAGWKHKAQELLGELPKGIMFARREPDVALALFSSFTARAQTLVVTAFIPLYINHYYIDHGCASPCHRAIVLSAALTGSIQLVSLLFAPLVGAVAPHLSSSLTLATSSFIGVISFAAFAFLPNGNPSSWIVWVAGFGMGLSQIGGIVVGLALVAQGRVRIMARDTSGTSAKEVGGAISGVYAAAGGLGILVVGKIGGSLFDSWVGAPFAIIAVLDVLSVVGSLLVYYWER